MTKNSLVITIIVVVIVGVLGFFGGVQYQKSQGGSFPGGGDRALPGGTNQQGEMARQGNLAGSRPVSGEITSIDESTITIKTQDGSSKIIIYSDSTTVNKTSEGSKEDLQVGEQATVVGTEGTDGTVTAQSISIGGNSFEGMPGGQPPDQSE